MNLKDKADSIAAAFEKKRSEVRASLEECIKDREAAYDEYRKANTGDRAENAPLDAAIDHMKKANAKILATEKFIKTIDALPDISTYNSVGFVVEFATVRIQCEGEEFVYRIYPKGISFIEIGIIAADSRLAIAIMGKRAGDIVGVEDTSIGATIEYKILEVY